MLLHRLSILIENECAININFIPLKLLLKMFPQHTGEKGTMPNNTEGL